MQIKCIQQNAGNVLISKGLIQMFGSLYAWIIEEYFDENKYVGFTL